MSISFYCSKKIVSNLLRHTNLIVNLRMLLIYRARQSQSPPKEGARSALFSNLCKFGLDNYAVKCSKRPLLEEVA